METKLQRPLQTWTVAELDFSVEYPGHILDEINAYALDGLKRLSRSGIAVGGVFFGTRGENSVRILTWRPISCEHATASAFVLSQKDRAGLALLLHNAHADPELAGLHAVGWFVSHTREGVSLTESDLEIFSHFFPWNWQVALVVRPFRDRPTRAGFFVRDREGRVKSDVSHREFQIEGVAGRLARAVNLPVIAEYKPAVQALPPKALMPNPDPTPPGRSFAPTRIFSGRGLWIWAVPVVLAGLIWALLLDTTKPAPAPVSPPSIGFHAVDSGGRLRLEWDQSVQSVREATRGALVIRDGGAPPLRIDLHPDGLASGSYIYPRKSGDVDIVLTVFPAAGKPIEESARFVGSPTSLNTGDALELRSDRDALAQENERLRDDLRRETSRNRELEDTIRALKDRVDSEHIQKPK